MGKTKCINRSEILFQTPKVDIIKETKCDIMSHIDFQTNQNGDSHMMDTLKRLGGHFIYGLITLLPLMITFGLIGWIVIKINVVLGKSSWIGNILGKISTQIGFSHTAILVLSYLFAILVVALFGYLVRRYAKLRFQDKAKKVMEHFPVLNTVYNTAEQVVGFIGKKDDQLGSFGEVVMVKYANMMVMGLLSSRKQFEIEGVPHVMIYFPSTPMPATGFNYLIPVDDVLECDLSFEEMSKVLLSLGALAPQVLGDKVSTKKFVK